jgi:hypothetical protein
MIEWLLVFWLQYPENLVEHSKYTTERECRDAEQLWQRRFNIVNSKLRAQCREQAVDRRQQ